MFRVPLCPSSEALKLLAGVLGSLEAGRVHSVEAVIRLE